jgi:hypothetical protein
MQILFVVALLIPPLLTNRILCQTLLTIIASLIPATILFLTGKFGLSGMVLLLNSVSNPSQETICFAREIFWAG